MSFVSVSIDLDEIDCYRAIHGISTGDSGGASNLVYGKGLPRAIRFFEELGIKVTYFAVGRDLEKSPDIRSLVHEVALSGNEIGNHTMSHRYDFATLSAREQEEEIRLCADAIERTVGVRPVGFRAPGYNVNLGILAMLEQQGYHYDSSVFPCPAYYAAKAGAIGVKALQGRKSASIVGDPRVLKAPTLPYLVDEADLYSRGTGFPEIPISVVTRARLPFIGTSIGMMGPLPAKLFAKQAAKLPFVNLELHGIDFIDADGDAIGYLKAHQPDLKIPLVKRRRALHRAIRTLLDAGLEPVTLREAVSRILI